MFPLPSLKPAVCLTLGAYAIFCCSAANALTTYSLNYSSSGSSSLSGSLTIDETQAPTTDSFGGGLPSWLTNIEFTNTVSGVSTTYPKSDYFFYNWNPKSSSIDFNSDLVPQFNNINFSTGGGAPSAAPSANGFFTMGATPNPDTYTLTSATPVPAPLPLLGLGAAAAFSRKLKQRIALKRKRDEVGAAV